MDVKAPVDVRKVVSLSVMPFQASMLCFEVPGIIGELNAELGSPVTSFDLDSFYKTLSATPTRPFSATPTSPDDPARLQYDFSDIQDYVKNYTLAALRAEASKAALSKAINLRANSFYAKYANARDLIKATRRAYDVKIGDKIQLINMLINTSTDQFNQLSTAYKNDTSGSTLKKYTVSTVHNYSCPEFKELDTTYYPGDMTSFSRQRLDNGTYSAPWLENDARFYRQQIGLIDELFNLFANNQSVDYLENVFQNELSCIDSDVYRMQIAYLNTILVSPISGVVTAIYKKLGEAVQPGEPVLRVENNNTVYLAATLICHGAIPLNSRVYIRTDLFDVVDAVVEGTVVSTRCNDTDDQWNIVVKCWNNILPLGYRFDVDNTSMKIK